MVLTILSGIINVLLIAAFIIDRIFRLKSLKEFKDAKQAQIENLTQQLAIEKTNNDVVITEMHKKRVESLKIILEERDLEIEKNKAAILELKAALTIDKSSDLLIIKEINSSVQKELKRLNRYKETSKELLTHIILS